MTPAERFEEWRQFLVARGDDLAAALAEARSDLAARQRAHRDAVAQLKDLDDSVAAGSAGLVNHQGLAGPLYSLYQNARTELIGEQAKAFGEARVRVRSLEEQLASVGEAIAQVDRLLTAAKVTPLRPADAPGRRAPPPVEFDDIAMPG